MRRPTPASKSLGRAPGLLLSMALAGIGCGPSDGPGPQAAPLEPKHRAAEILAARQPLVRSARWVALLDAAPPDALPALRDALAEAPIDYGEPELVSFALWWAGFDPEAAYAWSQQDWRAESWPVLVAVFRSWGHHEPEAAFSELGRVPKELQSAAISGLVAGWHESGRPGLVEQVRAIPDQANRQRVAEILARRVVLDLGTPDALRWTEGISEPGFRRIMERRIASSAAHAGDAASVAAWATPRVSSGDAHPSGFPRRIATRWVRRDPEAAFAWLESLPAGKDRDDGVMEAYRDWLRLRPGAALLWIRDAEFRPWLEPAYALHARRMGRQRPEEALEILSRFQDATQRERFTLMVLRDWAGRDPEAAGAWLAGTELPEVLRQRAETLLEQAAEAPAAGRARPGAAG